MAGKDDKSSEKTQPIGEFVKEIGIAIARGGFAVSLKKAMSQPVVVASVAQEMFNSEMQRLGKNETWATLGDNEKALWCFRSTDAMRGIRVLLKVEGN